MNLKKLIFNTKYLYRFLLFFAFASVVSWFSSESKLLIYIAAFGPVAISYLLEIYDQKMSKPVLEILGKDEKEYLLLTLRSSKELEMIMLDVPINGQYVKFVDNNSKSKGHCTFNLYGVNTSISTNNILEIVIRNVLPDNKLTYKIYYNEFPFESINCLVQPLPKEYKEGAPGPLEKNMNVETIYQWMHKGEKQTSSSWFNMKTGKEIEKPKKSSGFAVFQRGPYDKEFIDRIYEEGKRTYSK